MSIYKEQLPQGWPEGLPLPTLKEAQAAVEESKKLVQEARERRRGKLLRTDKDLPTTIVGK